jgi:hypothetical protein
MPTQAHYIVMNRRISLSATSLEHPCAPKPAAQPLFVERVFFVDALCVGRESKD